MKIDTNSKKIEDILTHGIEEVVDKKNLKQELFSGKKLRIKHGVDPTGPKIHIGRATQLWKLKAFQDLGHQVVLIVGDFTAQIGDASDKQAMRKILTEKEIKENMKNYLNQIGKILDIKKTEIRYNSEWLGKLSAKDLLSLSINFTAQQMIQRRNFKERWDQGKPIGLHELSYPLFQGYDSVVLKADVEVGGFDQLFNLKAGRDIQRAHKQKPQNILATKMLSGLDGKKMSTSWSNVINIIDKPADMYGKVMSMRDEMIPNYFELCTKVPIKEVKKIKKLLEAKKVNPRDVKAKLARDITSLYYGKEAEKAEEEFNNVFKEKKAPSKITAIKFKEDQMEMVNLVEGTGLVCSKSEARRVVEQGGVKIDDKVRKNYKEIVKIKDGMVIQVGKRKFVKIVLR